MRVRGRFQPSRNVPHPTPLRGATFSRWREKDLRPQFLEQKQLDRLRGRQRGVKYQRFRHWVELGISGQAIMSSPDFNSQSCNLGVWLSLTNS